MAIKLLKKPLLKSDRKFVDTVLDEVKVLKHVRRGMKYLVISFSHYTIFNFLIFPPNGQLDSTLQGAGVLKNRGCYYDGGRVAIVTQRCKGGDMFDMYVCAEIELRRRSSKRKKPQTKYAFFLASVRQDPEHG